MLQRKDERFQRINAVPKATHVKVEPLKAREDTNTLVALVQKVNLVHQSKCYKSFDLRSKARYGNAMINFG
jgi:hypothetical protein